jgi:DnaJ-class molecular chaperone
MAKTHYHTLGLKRGSATGPEDIRRAFRELARKLHPDVNRAPDATARFALIQNAYETLNDPQRRAAYDAQLELDDARASGRLLDPDAAPHTGPRTAHYTWTNVADPKARSSQPFNSEDFQELYDAFFAPRKRDIEAAARRAPDQ